MAWQHRFERGDPAVVLERRQSPPPRRSCAGCDQLRFKENPFGGPRKMQCAQGNPVGERCKSYKERSNG